MATSICDPVAEAIESLEKVAYDYLLDSDPRMAKFAEKTGKTLIGGEPTDSDWGLDEEES